MKFNLVFDRAVLVSGVYFRNIEAGNVLWGIEDGSTRVGFIKDLKIEYGVVPAGYSSAYSYAAATPNAADELQVLVAFRYDAGAPYASSEVFRMKRNGDSIVILRDRGASLAEKMPPEYAGDSVWRGKPGPHGPHP